MTIPFLSFFKRGTKPAEHKAELPVPRPVDKPRSERFSKTVMPNAARTFGAADDMTDSIGADGAPRTVSMGGASNPPPRIPPAVALALEPKIERVVALLLEDVLPKLPEGFTKPADTLDGKRQVLLKSSEVEKGMTVGNPQASLASIYQQMPEIFLRAVPASDTTLVSLPFEKVLEAFSHVQVRSDQVRDQTVPQVETPFLKATLEDNKRFGLPTDLPQTSSMPPVRLEPATAATISKSQPEAVAAAVLKTAQSAASPVAPAPRRVSLNDPKLSVAPAPTPPARVPFQLPPNGAGVSASERVPASSGPPVPTPSSASAPSPARIPFKISAPSDDLRGAFQKSAGPVSLDPQVDDRRLALKLKSVLQSLLPFQRKGNLAEVPEEATIELPFSLIEPQLATGKICVSTAVFEQALSEKFRRFFDGSDDSAPVTLPLQEVLMNLPTASLKMRDDQEELVAGETFVTPFSSAAEEDAKRFGTGTSPAAPATTKAAEEPAPKKEAAPTVTALPPHVPLASVEKAAPPQMLTAAPSVAAPTPPSQLAPEKTVPTVDAKGIVAKASALAGVKACALSFTDGLSLAGNLPDEMAAEGLCAMAPSMLQKIGNHMGSTKLGHLNAMTLHCASSTISFFMHGNVCLAALHAAGELATDIRDQLAGMVRELSAIYSQPESAHVHH